MFTAEVMQLPVTGGIVIIPGIVVATGGGLIGPTGVFVMKIQLLAGIMFL